MWSVCSDNRSVGLLGVLEGGKDQDGRVEKVGG